MIDEIDKHFKEALERREIMRIKIAVIDDLQLRLRQNQELASPVSVIQDIADYSMTQCRSTRRRLRSERKCT